MPKNAGIYSFGMANTGQRNDGHAGIERCDGRITAAIRKRVEHEVDNAIACPFAPSSSPRGMNRAHAASIPEPSSCRMNAGWSTGDGGENRRTAHGTSPRIVRQRARQRGESFRTDKFAQHYRTFRDAQRFARRPNEFTGRCATERKTQDAIARGLSIWKSPASGRSAYRSVSLKSTCESPTAP